MFPFSFVPLTANPFDPYYPKHRGLDKQNF